MSVSGDTTGLVPVEESEPAASLPLEYHVKMIRTVSLRPDLPEGRFLPMLETCAEIFNEHTKWATKNRTYSKQKAHDALYCSIRESHPEIPSAILQATRDCALEASRRCNKGKKDKWKTPTKNTRGVRYDLRTLSVRGDLLTLSCIGRRFRIMLDCEGGGRAAPDAMVLHIPEHFREVVRGWRCKAATLNYDRRHGFRLNLNYEADAPPKVAGQGLGIDLGIRKFAVTSDGVKHPGPRAAKRRYGRNRRTLQAKGTKSAKRRLRAMSGREMRFSRDVCHAVSKGIANTAGVNLFVLEDLRGIRKKRRGRRLNRHIHGWPFHLFREFLTYKAVELGKSVVTVSPAYTSQRCSECGHTESGNRQGSRFHCRMCGFCCHADTNAAINILFAYESGTKLCASVPCPPVSRRKAPGGQAVVNQPTMRQVVTA